MAYKSDNDYKGIKAYDVAGNVLDPGLDYILANGICTDKTGKIAKMVYTYSHKPNRAERRARK